MPLAELGGRCCCGKRRPQRPSGTIERLLSGILRSGVAFLAATTGVGAGRVRRGTAGTPWEGGVGLYAHRLWPVVGGDAGCLSGQEDAVAEEVESGASVHLSQRAFGLGVLPCMP